MSGNHFGAHIGALGADLIDRARAGVVQVRADSRRPGRRSEHRGEREVRGAGSGIVWAEGQIITNHHVVAGRETVEVVTSDGVGLEARVRRSDARLDLASLEVNGSLGAASIGDSGLLRVGEVVFALGHPWGQPWVATAGVVTALGEAHLPGRGSSRGRELIRTDAQLRPGNSGGALLNARGEVVGVNAMVWHGDLGVAIPSRVVQGWLASAPGFRLGVQVQAVAITRGLERSRALMVVGLEDGPALRAGMNVGDVLLEVNGTVIDDADALLEALAAVRMDSKLELTVLRAGQTRTVQVPTGREYARAA